jgi:hypothetical protein
MSYGLRLRSIFAYIWTHLRGSTKRSGKKKGRLLGEYNISSNVEFIDASKIL